MAFIKIVEGKYTNSDAVVNAIDYITDNSKAIYVGTLGLLYSSSNKIMEDQFMAVKNAYHKMEGRLLRHFVVSFSRNEDIGYEEAIDIGYKIAAYYGNDYQIIFAVHINTNVLHIHFVMNSVSYRTGIKYAGGEEDFQRLTAYVNNCF